VCKFTTAEHLTAFLTALCNYSWLPTMGSIPLNSPLDMEARPQQFMEITAISGLILYIIMYALLLGG
jgi:hypothetical protein